jgi:hypothetical protein
LVWNAGAEEEVGVDFFCVRSREKTGSAFLALASVEQMRDTSHCMINAGSGMTIVYLFEKHVLYFCNGGSEMLWARRSGEAYSYFDA